jgi:hypothetical protein
MSLLFYMSTKYIKYYDFQRKAVHDRTNRNGCVVIRSAAKCQQSSKFKPPDNAQF